MENAIFSWPHEGWVKDEGTPIIVGGTCDKHGSVVRLYTQNTVIELTEDEVWEAALAALKCMSESYESQPSRSNRNGLLTLIQKFRKLIYNVQNHLTKR